MQIQVINNQNEKQLDKYQLWEQAGSLTDHLQSLFKVIKKSNKYKQPLYIAFYYVKQEILKMYKNIVSTINIETIASIYKTAQHKWANHLI